MAQLLYVGETAWERIRWQKQRGPWDSQNTLDGLFGSGIPTKGIGPGHSYIVDLDAARLGQTEADVVPIVREEDCWLICFRESEDVFVCPFINLLPLVLFARCLRR